MTEIRPKLVGKKVNVDQLIEVFMNMIESSKESAAGALFDSNPAWREDNAADDDDDDDDYDGPTQCGIAQGTLDVLAIHLPQKVFFETCITKCVQRMQSPNPAVRKSGIASLGVVAEGCQEKLTRHLAEIVPRVLSLAQDADTQVRECTCFALGQLAEHCQPDILSYSSTVLPNIFRLLEDPSENVQTTSCHVLEMFCESLDPESVLPFLNPLMTRLVVMLEHSTQKSVREMTVGAIAATAVAAELEFIPYLPGVANIMQRFISLNEVEHFPLKGRALECMGHMAVAVEKEAFRPYFTQTVAVAGHALNLDDLELHEFVYALFANLAKVMEREFSPVLPELVPRLLAVVDKSDGGLEAIDAGPKDLSGLDESDDEEGDNQNYVVRTADIDCKRQALVALHGMASYCAQDFMPFLEDTTRVVMKQVACSEDEYWHPAVVCEGFRTLASLSICSVAANHEDGKVRWVKGDLSANPMSPHTTAVINAIMPVLVAGLKNEDKDVVASAADGIVAVMDLCGPFALATVANDLLQNVMLLLTNKGLCQEYDDDEEDEEDEEGEHQNFLNSIFDVLGSFSKCMGEQFAQYLPTFLAPIAEFSKTSRPTNDRSMAAGCLGDIADGVGTAISPYWESHFLPIIIGGLADEEPGLQRNCAYTLGVCATALTESIAAQYPQILQSIHPIFSLNVDASDANACSRDNAVGAVCKMMLAAPATFPFAQVLPIVLGSLPLKSDMLENEGVYDCLIKLTQMNQPDLAGPLKMELMRVVQTAMQEKKVDDEIKAKLKTAFGV
jgi:hypothetical protein